MTLYELGKEYIKEAQILSRLIKSYSVQCENLNGIRLYELNGDILKLKDMEREMRLTGKKLMSYYDAPQCKHYMSHNKNEYF